MTKVSSAGQHFEATGGEVLNSDDFFIAREKKKRDMEIVQLKNSKKLAEEHKQYSNNYICWMTAYNPDKDPILATKEILEKDYTIKGLKALVSWQLLGKKVPAKKKIWWKSGLRLEI